MNDLLSERQKIEKNYHNLKYSSDNLTNSVVRESTAHKYFASLIGDVKDLRVLDYGCGKGWIGVNLAKSGADVYGIDISEELLKQARNLSKVEEVSDKIHFIEMSGENLTFENDYFDLVLGSSILHHTEISLSLNNILRVLKPDGRAIFIEPLNQNIFLRLWRKITPGRRSPAEKALTNNELELIRKTFAESKFIFFTFLSIFSEGLLILLPRNKLLLFFNDLMEMFDKLILKVVPSLGKYSAVVVLDLRKK